VEILQLRPFCETENKRRKDHGLLELKECSFYACRVILFAVNFMVVVDLCQGLYLTDLAEYL